MHYKQCTQCNGGGIGGRDGITGAYQECGICQGKGRVVVLNAEEQRRYDEEAARIAAVEYAMFACWLLLPAGLYGGAILYGLVMGFLPGLGNLLPPKAGVGFALSGLGGSIFLCFWSRWLRPGMILTCKIAGGFLLFYLAICLFGSVQ